MSDRLRDLLSRFDPSLPLERAHTVPREWYVDPEVYAAECRAVFTGGWQFAGRLDQLPGPGSFFTAEVAGEPIVVLRDEQGTLRAFTNVCRHKASVIVNEPAGKVSRLRCQYHGWTYDLMGRLRGTPEFDGVADFCREDHGLPRWAVATWGPFVWVHPGESQIADRRLQIEYQAESCSGNLQSAICNLQSYLDPMPRQTAGLGLDRLRFVARKEYDLACNWKVFVDNYLDGGYHINTVHPGLADVIDYSQYRTETAAFTSVQTGPLQPKKDAAFGTVRAGELAYYGWVFPNFMIDLYRDVMDTNWVLPLGPDRCRVVFDFYFADTDGPEAKRFQEESIAVAHQIQLEDQGVCENVQRGLHSRFYDTGRFSVRRETAGYHFHRLLAERLRSASGVA